MQPIRRFSQVEDLFRRHVSDRVIRGLLKHRGIPCEVYRKKIIPSASIFNPTEDASDLSKAALDVFGDYSGISPAVPEPIVGTTDVTGNVTFCAKIVITKIPNNPWDAASSGSLEQMIIFTDSPIIPQDLIVIKCEDGTVKRGMVGDALSWGITDSVYKVFTFNNYGDGLRV